MTTLAKDTEPALNAEWLAENSLSLPQGLPYERWVAAGEQLKLMAASVQWWLGDWLNYGERAYGDKYQQALEETDYSINTLQQYSWVARTWEICDRTQLSWSHHKLLAGQSDKQKWLNLTLENGWSSNELRRQIQGVNGATTLITIPQPELEAKEQEIKDLRSKLTVANNALEKLTVEQDISRETFHNDLPITDLTTLETWELGTFEKLIEAILLFLDEPDATNQLILDDCITNSKALIEKHKK